MTFNFLIVNDRIKKNVRKVAIRNIFQFCNEDCGLSD